MPPRLLSKFEQDTFVEALTQIDAAGKKQKLAEYAAAVEQERAARVAAEAKIGELMAELVKRSEGYRAAVADMDTKLIQARESAATANILAAQARAEADAERRNSEENGTMLESLQAQITALMQVERVEQVQDTAPPASYRVNVIGRDAAGDLRTLELVPVERK
jgi:hypothetical protein